MRGEEQGGRKNKQNSLCNHIHDMIIIGKRDRNKGLQKCKGTAEQYEEQTLFQNTRQAYSCAQ